MIYVCIALITYMLYDLDRLFFKQREKFYSLKREKRYLTDYFKFSYLALSILILFAGLRTSSVGYDMLNYENNFQLIADRLDANNGHNFEIFFQLLNLICAFIFGKKLGFNMMLLFSAAIIVLCVNFATRKMSPNVPMSIYLFVTVGGYLRSFDQMRQGIAIAILMCAVASAIKKKPFQYLMFVLCATLFHKAAIIFLPVYFFDKIKFRYINYIAILVLAFLFSMFYVEILKFFCALTRFDYYEKYIVTKFGVQDLTLIGKFEIIADLFILLFFLIYRYLFKKKFDKIPQNYDMFLNIFFMSFIFYIVSAITKTQLLFGRLIYYFFWALIFIVPIFLNSLDRNKKTTRILYISCLIVGMLYLILSIYMIDANGVANYISTLS